MANDKLPENPIKINKKKPQMLLHLKFLTITNLHNLKKQDVYNYIVKLHKTIRLLRRKLKKFKHKIVKLVGDWEWWGVASDDD